LANVPQAYFEFIMHYAPCFYVVQTALAGDVLQGQKELAVVDGTKFQAGFPAKIQDTAHSEWNQIQSVNGDIITMENNLANSYSLSKNGLVEGPDPIFGKGSFSAAFAIEFLYEAYFSPQFYQDQLDILVKIISLSDWLLAQQCTLPQKAAYGGFKNTETANEYWSVDAGRAIPALLKVYTLTGNSVYFDAAKLAGYHFLFSMQQKPAELGLHDRYYGGFAQYITDSEGWSPQMPVENLYCLIGLKMLAETYDSENASRYNNMMDAAAEFLRYGLENLWLYFDAFPSGDGSWHRVGIGETEVYDDPVSFALLGLYSFEGWSQSCQRVYNYVQSIRSTGQYPGYVSDVCWPGYIDVANRFPACPYYDGITIGILAKIRREHDPPSYKLAHDISTKYSEAFLNWGPLFTDYSPVTSAKAVANVSWIGRMFLGYQEPTTSFTQILKCKGETIQLFHVRQTTETVDYGSPIDLKAVVSPTKSEQVLIEPGYFLNDYLAFYSFLPVRVNDKLRRQGEDYQVQTVTPFTYANQRYYFKSTARRLIT
jgi:hypothetical protein